MATFKFLGDLKTSEVANFWRLASHDIPASPGVYFLIAKPGVRFTYPGGTSSIFYVGQAGSLQRRLFDHLRFSTHVREKRRVGYSLYWPRYEYAGVFGGRYCYIATPRRSTPKALEDLVLARFAHQYRAFPVANSAGAWNQVV